MHFFKRRNEPGWLAILPRRGRLEYAYAVRTGERPALKWLRREPHEAGREFETMVAVRRSLGLHKGYRCCTTISRGTYQTFEVPAPKVDRGEWREALRWVIKDGLEFPVEDAMIEAIEIPHEGAPAGREPMAYVIAAQRHTVAARVHLFQRAGMRLKVVSVANMAQRNTAALFEQPGRGLAFFALYELGGLLTFTCDGEIYASRHLTYTTEGLTDDVDAERRQQQIDRVCLDVQRALDSFDRQFSYVSLQRVVVAAPPRHDQLVAALRQNLNQLVEVADLRNVMDVSACPEIDDPQLQVGWLHAIGMSLRLEGDL